MIKITGLDPAAPLIPDDLTERLDRTDAIYVEVIHTSTNWLGMEAAVGTASFYINGGRTEFTIRDPLGINAHTEAYIIFARSVRGELFIGYPCYTVAHAREGFYMRHAPTRYLGGEPGNFRTFVFVFIIISSFQINLARIIFFLTFALQGLFVLLC